MTGVRRTARGLAVVGAPSSAGAYGPGQERAPAAFRRHGLLPALAGAGRDVVDRGDGRLRTWAPDPEHPTAANVEHVASAALELADSVADAMSDEHEVLVIGGDCTVELGTVLGAIRDGASVGLAYVDLDADLNTPLTGDGIVDWMGVAHLLGVDGAHPRLATLGGAAPLLPPPAVRLFAVDNITVAEQEVVERLGIHVEPLAAVTGDLAAVAERTRAWAASFDRILVHVDVDVLDYAAFPIAENSELRGGLALHELTALLVDLCSLPNWRTITVCEVNPAHAPDERRSIRDLIAMLTEALTRS